MFDYKSEGVSATKMNFTAADLGLTSQSDRQAVLKAISAVSEGKAICRCERNNAMILYIGVPDVDESGAVYIYTKRDGELWLLDFPNSRDGNLTKGQCERLFARYHLSELAYRPNLVFPKPPAQNTGTPGKRKQA